MSSLSEVLPSDVVSWMYRNYLHQCEESGETPLSFDAYEKAFDKSETDPM